MKDQSFSTRYAWAEPTTFEKTRRGGRKFNAHLVIGEGEKKRRWYVPDGLVAWVEEHGGMIEFEAVPPEYAEAMRALGAALKERCEKGGSAFVSDISGSVRVETPTSLGSEEHYMRRALVERTLGDLGLSFEVECATLHSDMVCKPLPPKLLERASLAPGGDALTLEVAGKRGEGKSAATHDGAARAGEAARDVGAP